MNDANRKIDIFYKELKAEADGPIEARMEKIGAVLQWLIDNKVTLSRHPEMLSLMMENAEKVTSAFFKRRRKEDAFLLNYIIGKSCYSKHSTRESYKYCNIALNIYAKLSGAAQEKCLKKAAFAHYYTGMSAYMLSLYDEASRHHYASLKLLEELDDDSNAGMNYNGLGFVHRNLKDYAKAMENFRKANEIGERFEKDDIRAIALNEIGNIYMIQGDYEKSMEYHQKALDVAEEGGIQSTSAFIYHDIAVMHTEKDEYKEALAYFKKHYDLIFDTLTDREKAICTLNMSTIYVQLSDYENAEKLARESLDFAINTEGLYEQSNAYEELAHIHANKGEFEGAFDNLKKAYRLSKEVFSKDRMDLIQVLQVKYESQAREREAEIYRLKNVELVEANQKLRESYDKLEKAQQEIIQLEKQKSVWAMAVTANHEINQPLMVIRGNMDLLRMKMDRSTLTDKHNQYLVNIEKSIERIGEILRKFKEQCPIRFTEYSSSTEMVIFEKG